MQEPSLATWPEPADAQAAVSPEHSIQVPDLALESRADDEGMPRPGLQTVDVDLDLDEPLVEAASTPQLAEPELPELPVAESEPAPISDLAQPSFVRQAQRRAGWQRPWVRVLLNAFALLLLLTLGLQVTVQERDRIAVMVPELKPWLQQLCEPLQCELAPFKQIDAIVIDGSSFSKIRNDNYRLSFSLKNVSPWPLATPAVELTLTDTQDQPVLRRVILPREVALAPVSLDSGSEWQPSLTLALDGKVQVAGYRLLAFYP
jgi:hypothetical protein